MRETHTADPAEQTSEMLPTFTCGVLLLTNIATNSKCRESDATNNNIYIITMLETQEEVNKK